MPDTNVTSSVADTPGHSTGDRSILPSILAVNCMIMGCLGCLITLMILHFLTKRKHSSINTDVKIAYLVLILDFLGSLGTFLVGVCSMTPYNLWAQFKWLCNMNAFFLVSFFYASNYTVAMMCFQRYLLVIHKKSIPDWAWYVFSAVIILLCIGNVSLLIGFDLVELMPLTIYCLTSSATNIGYAAIIMYCILGIISWITVIFCYIAICIHRRTEDIKLAKTMNLDINSVKAHSGKILIRSLIIVVIYLLANSLEIYNIISELATKGSRTLLMDFISFSLLNINCVCNGLLLLWLNSKFKLEFKKFYNIK